MFAEAYQSGPSLEIFSPHGKDPLVAWKLTHASGVRKDFDKYVRGFVVHSDGGATKLQLPKDEKKGLAMTQPFLVFQITLPPEASCCIEITVSDEKKTRRRLVLSTSFKDIAVNPLHAQLPLSCVRRNQWLNLCIDVAQLCLDCFKQPFRSIECFSLGAACTIRKIFSLKSPPHDTSDDSYQLGWQSAYPPGSHDQIPKALEFPAGVASQTQMVSLGKIIAYLQHLHPSYSPAILGQQHLQQVALQQSHSKSSSSYHDHEHAPMPGTRSQTVMGYSEHRPEPKINRRQSAHVPRHSALPSHKVTVEMSEPAYAPVSSLQASRLSQHDLDDDDDSLAALAAHRGSNLAVPLYKSHESQSRGMSRVDMVADELLPVEHAVVTNVKRSPGGVSQLAAAGNSTLSSNRPTSIKANVKTKAAAQVLEFDDSRNRPSQPQSAVKGNRRVEVEATVPSQSRVANRNVHSEASLLSDNDQLRQRRAQAIAQYGPGGTTVAAAVAAAAHFANSVAFSPAAQELRDMNRHVKTPLTQRDAGTPLASHRLDQYSQRQLQPVRTEDLISRLYPQAHAYPSVVQAQSHSHIDEEDPSESDVDVFAHSPAPQRSQQPSFSLNLSRTPAQTSAPSQQQARHQTQPSARSFASQGTARSVLDPAFGVSDGYSHDMYEDPVAAAAGYQVYDEVDDEVDPNLLSDALAARDHEALNRSGLSERTTNHQEISHQPVQMLREDQEEDSLDFDTRAHAYAYAVQTAHSRADQRSRAMLPDADSNTPSRNTSRPVSAAPQSEFKMSPIQQHVRPASSATNTAAYPVFNSPSIGVAPVVDDVDDDNDEDDEIHSANLFAAVDLNGITRPSQPHIVPSLDESHSSDTQTTAELFASTPHHGMSAAGSRATSAARSKATSRASSASIRNSIIALAPTRHMVAATPEPARPTSRGQWSVAPQDSLSAQTFQSSSRVASASTSRPARSLISTPSVMEPTRLNDSLVEDDHVVMDTSTASDSADLAPPTQSMNHHPFVHSNGPRELQSAQRDAFSPDARPERVSSAGVDARGNLILTPNKAMYDRRPFTPPVVLARPASGRVPAMQPEARPISAIKPMQSNVTPRRDDSLRESNQSNDSRVGTPMTGRAGTPMTERSNNGEDIDLLYDPILQCYYDPRTTKYYEMK